MTTTTTRLGLILEATSDNYLASDLVATLTILDQYPGIFIGTTSVITTKVSTWGSAQTGQTVYDVTVGLPFRWNGSALIRTGPAGLLGTNQTTSNQTATSGTSPKTLVSQTVTVPPSPRTVKVTAFIPSISNPTQNTTIAIVRDSTTLQQIVVPVTTWRAAGGSADADFPQNRYIVVYDTPIAGSHAYSIQASVSSGTATFVATATSAITIGIEEF